MKSYAINVAEKINAVDHEEFPSKGTVLSSQYGHLFDMESNRWELSRDHIVTLDWLEQVVSCDLALTIRSGLAHYATSNSPHTAYNVNGRMRVFLKYARENSGSAIEEISAAHLMLYRQSLANSQDSFMNYPLEFLRFCFERKYTGINPDVANYVERVKIRPNTKGFASATLCPKKGPFTDFERADIYDAIMDAYEANKINVETLAICLLILSTGRRPAQIADLKVGDLLRTCDDVGRVEYTLLIPRRKQRDGWRNQLKPIKIISDIGQALELHIEGVLHKFKVMLGNFSKAVEKGLPMFPSWHRVESALESSEGRAEVLGGSELFHKKTKALSSVVSKFIQSENLPSRIEGDSLEAPPIRFRRTLATEAIRENLPPMVVAEMLDHETLQSISIYAASLPEYMDRVTAATAEQLSPYVKAFKGELIERPFAGGCSSHPDATVKISQNQGCGNCRHEGGCYANAPYACYTCKSFRPWLDAPHQELLTDLLERRERMREVTGDIRIASAMDRVIVAVAEVVRLCEARGRPSDMGRNYVK